MQSSSRGGAAGLVLRHAVLRMPGGLGNLARLFPAGPAQALAGTPEVFPIYLPNWEAEDEDIHMA